MAEWEMEVSNGRIKGRRGEGRRQQEGEVKWPGTGKGAAVVPESKAIE